MELKRIVAPDMRTALRILREELGPDAIILSNKKVEQGVEIVSAMEMPEIDPEQVQTLQVDSALSSPRGMTESQHQPQSAGQHPPTDPETLGSNLESNLAYNSESNSAEINEQQADLQKALGRDKLEEVLADREGKVQRPLADRVPVHKVSIHDMFRKKSTALHQEDEMSASSTIIDDSLNKSPTEPSVKVSLAAEEHVVEETVAQHAQYQETDEQNVTSRHMRRAIDEEQASTLDNSLLEIPRLIEEAPHPGEMSIQVIQAELRGMRDLLQQQLSGLGWQQLASNNPVEATIWRRLDQMGLPAAVAKSCMPAMDQETSLETAWRFTLGNLVNQVSTTGDIAAAGGTYALVGPTGVGKTTTIGKLAARYVLEHGADKVAILTTDTYRIGAHEQLRIIGRILHVPVKVVEDHRQLGRALRSFSDKSLILIDTAGLTQRDVRLNEQLDSLAELQTHIQSYLVVAANSQLETMEAAYQTYKRAKIQGCVLTKLDETSSLGEALGMLVQQQLKLAYITDGQEIPDDVKIAHAVDLVSKSVSMMRRKGALETETDLAEQIPALWKNQAAVNGAVKNEIAFS